MRSGINQRYQPVVSTTTSGINQRSGMRCEEVLVTLKQNIKGGDERGQKWSWGSTHENEEKQVVLQREG